MAEPSETPKSLSRRGTAYASLGQDSRLQDSYGSLEAGSGGATPSRGEHSTPKAAGARMLTRRQTFTEGEQQYPSKFSTWTIEQDEDTMTGASLVVNLLADVSPAGVLPLAYGMSGTGYIPAVVLLMLFACGAGYSMYLISRTIEISGVKSYDRIWERCIGERRMSMSSSDQRNLDPVPPERWCVTKHDLEDFQSEVMVALRQKRITPPPSDGGFDSYGPSIYAVTEQYIKPTTQGKYFSWALKKHPDGLDCDVFISHAWQEGIFEFLEKVLNSWPKPARNAWCCMLANPQNLNIAVLLRSPRQSPFACALEQATYVLAVPNRKSSIYTRLWCAYEAHLASEQGKVVLIARRPIGHDFLQAVPMLMVATAFGAVLGIVIRNFTEARDRMGANLATIILLVAVLLLGTLVHGPQKRRAMNLCGVACSACLFFSWLTRHFWLPLPTGSEIVPKILQHWTIAIALCAFWMAEVDRICSESLEEEAVQLNRGLEDQASVEFATCTQESDAVQIRAEIGDSFYQVDHSISVLLSAGMSTPTLRSIADAGVNIDGAGHYEITVPFVCLVPMIVVNIGRVYLAALYLQDELHYQAILSMRTILCLAKACLVVLIWRSCHEERAFIFKMITKLTAIMFVLTSCERLYSHLHPSYDPVFHVAIGHMTLVVMLGCALLGMKGIACLPGGRYVLQFFLCRGCPRLPSDRWKSRKLPARPCCAASSPSESESSPVSTRSNSS
ncbi:unnamed protein product [Symbiodinium sp. CCMP2456]|nr:unnamed protein product [Symbiodinium sp. CCMP2456]